MNKDAKFYRFVLVLSGFSEPNESIENALFEAGCDDALLVFRDSVPFLEFDRQATNFKESVSSAIFDVESANIGASVLRVKPSKCKVSRLRRVAILSSLLSFTPPFFTLHVTGKL